MLGLAVVRLDGVIGPRQWRTAMSLASHAAALERAFGTKRLSGVALAINSPGGSPVQSALLFRRIRQLAEEKGVPVFAFAAYLSLRLMEARARRDGKLITKWS